MKRNVTNVICCVIFEIFFFTLIRSSYTFLWCRSFFVSCDHFTDSMTPWASDQLVARPLPKHRTTQTHTHTKHPCLMWDSNPRSQLPSEQRQIFEYEYRNLLPKCRGVVVIIAVSHFGCPRFEYSPGNRLLCRVIRSFPQSLEVNAGKARKHTPRLLSPILIPIPHS
jgi:hypothetical protein